MRERKSRSRERKSSWWFSTPSSSDSLPFCFFSYRSPPLLTLTVFFFFFSIFLGVFYPSSLDFPGNERWDLGCLSLKLWSSDQLLVSDYLRSLCGQLTASHKLNISHQRVFLERDNSPAWKWFICCFSGLNVVPQHSSWCEGWVWQLISEEFWCQVAGA